MKTASVFKLLALAVMVTLTGCVTGNARIADESNTTIEQKIVKGKTTKNDMRTTFGEPSETGSDDGKEYWVYQMAKANGVGMIPFATLITGSSGISGKYLRITFNKKGTVESYALSESKL